MHKQDIKALLDNYLDGKLSESELQILLNTLDQAEHEEVWKAWIDNVWDNTDLHQRSDLTSKERVLANILGDQPDAVKKARIGMESLAETPSMSIESPLTSIDSVPVINIRRLRRFRYSVAAAVLLLIGSGAYLWDLHPKQSAPVAVQKHDVLPGGNKAVLTLANGQQIVLDSSQGQIVKIGNLSVVNVKGQLDYNGQATAVETHTLSTPQGGQYKLMLPDGTEVWLNSLSSITYPTAFIDRERTVSITGEAYFEVAKNRQKPFIVNTGGQRIEVLGTHFNVNAYSDEPLVKTTLTEGRVTISNNSEKLVLTPGQQSVVDKHGAMTLVNNPDIDETLAWKNGMFYFNGADIRTIMNQVARWYGVSIVYKDTIEEEFVAEISRDVPVSKLLQLLQLTSHVHFTIEDKTITVLK